jgi:environmental stress-induced protein Ves
MKAPINYQIIQKRNLKSSLWEGGETFEYYIYPKNSNYAARDFLFRISSATIQKTPSTFTKFEKYKRYLVMLTNSLEIHRNGNVENYAENEVFEFLSNDEITSYSLGEDFNLMVSEKIKNSSLAVTDFLSDENSDFLFVFAKEKTEIHLNEIELKLQSNDLVFIDNPSREFITLISKLLVLAGSIDL